MKELMHGLRTKHRCTDGNEMMTAWHIFVQHFQEYCIDPSPVLSHFSCVTVTRTSEQSLLTAPVLNH